MIELQIAGAGAGKTFGLATRIIEKHSSSDDHRAVYAITYTNSAKRKIAQEIIKQSGQIPNHIRIETVHGFFLNEIIYPYSPYLLAEIYSSAASSKLPTIPRYKNSKISVLKKLGIIHNEEVFQKAKIIVDRSNAKHGNKAKKEKVDFVLSHIASKIGHIYVDEAQDLDADALKVFQILGNNGIKIHLLGDPKQALRYPAAFRNFLNECTGEIYTHLENNNQTRRVPSLLLNLSNPFCHQEERQTSSSSVVGKLSFIRASNSNYRRALEHYKNLGKLIYIEQKDADYLTHQSKDFTFPEAIECKLQMRAKILGLDEKLFVASVMSELRESLRSRDVKACVNSFYKTFDVTYESKEYAELMEALNHLEVPSGTKHVVASIEAVKGLESDICIFILNQTMYNYLTLDISEDLHYNKNWNKVYVALTRSSEHLIFALDEALFTTTSMDDITKYFQSKSIQELELPF